MGLLRWGSFGTTNLVSHGIKDGMPEDATVPGEELLELEERIGLAQEHVEMDGVLNREHDRFGGDYFGGVVLHFGPPYWWRPCPGEDGGYYNGLAVDVNYFFA